MIARCSLRLALAALVFSAGASLGLGQTELDRLDHLSQAIRHLESAGFPQEAARVRVLADGERQVRLYRLLDQKLAALDQLKGEIEDLRRLLAPQSITPPATEPGPWTRPAISATLPPSSATGTPSATLPVTPIIAAQPQIKFSLRLVQLHLERMRAAGVALNSLTPPAADGPEAAVPLSFIDDQGTIGKLLQTLQDQRLVSVLAMPTVVTTNRRTAIVQVGSVTESAVRQAAATEGASSGIRLQVTPVILDSGKIQVAATFASVIGRNQVVTADCTAEIGSGQTIVLLDPRIGGPLPAGQGLVALLTAELILPCTVPPPDCPLQAENPPLSENPPPAPPVPPLPLTPVTPQPKAASTPDLLPQPEPPAESQNEAEPQSEAEAVKFRG